MTFDGIKVNHGAMQAASDDLRAACKKIDDRVNTLEHELQPLRAEWTGEAQQAYVVAKQRWDNQIIAMNQILAQASTGVADSDAAYSGADKQGAGLLGGI